MASMPPESALKHMSQNVRFPESIDQDCRSTMHSAGGLLSTDRSMKDTCNFRKASLEDKNIIDTRSN